MRKRKTLFFTCLMAATLFVTIPVSAAGNPYPTQQNVDHDAFYEVPCTWFAWQQVYDNEGVALPAWDDAGKWYSAAQNAGYSTGNIPKAGAVAVWTGDTYGHVAYVASVQSSTTFTVNEGGRTDLDQTSSHGVAYGYRLTNAVGARKPYDPGKTLVGFIYPKLEHTHSYTARSQVLTQPTCTTSGTERDFCSCGQYQDRTLPALGHAYVSRVVAPTMTERGYTLHTCSRCGNSYKDTYVDPPSKNQDGWYYMNSLPAGVDSSSYMIEYNNHYEKQQSTSPGSGWTQGQRHASYVNDGSQYEEYTTVNTSDTKVLVRYYYFHFCTTNLGKRVNYAQNGTYVHYDSIADPNSVNITSQGTDDDSASIPYYILSWKSGGEAYCESGRTCDGAYGSHGKRSNVWYRMNVYQNRHQVVTYTYTRDSGWVAQKDASANSVRVRFKPKEAKVESVRIQSPAGRNVVVRGSSAQFSAKVTGEYISDTSVNWTIDGNTSRNTVISNNGLLKVGSDEKSSTLTVKAISNADPTKSASITVKVQLFKDVNEDQFFYNAVKWGSDNSTVAGYSEADGTSTFRPNDNCTRAQFVTFLWRTMGSQKPKSSKNPFADISDIRTVYYGDAVLWAYENGYVAGYSDPRGVRFGADDEVTRGQAVTFLWRAAGSPKAKTTSSPFSDAVNPSQYFYGEAMLWANENGVVSGYSDPNGVRFGANDNCTRGQVVTFLWRYAEKFL